MTQAPDLVGFFVQPIRACLFLEYLFPILLILVVLEQFHQFRKFDGCDACWLLE